MVIEQSSEHHHAIARSPSCKEGRRSNLGEERLRLLRCARNDMNTYSVNNDPLQRREVHAVEAETNA